MQQALHAAWGRFCCRRLGGFTRTMETGFCEVLQNMHQEWLKIPKIKSLVRGHGTWCRVCVGLGFVLKFQEGRERGVGLS
jgi:hypothetical protein